MEKILLRFNYHSCHYYNDKNNIHIVIKTLNITIKYSFKYLFRMKKTTLFITIVVLLILLGVGIFLAIPFPLVVFQNIVNTQVYLQRKSDGQFPTGTYFWSRLPAVQYFNFYLWNVTNPDEVLYFGATPNMLESGPYTYAETEFKEYIEFHDDDNLIFYQNNKTWIFDEKRSCPFCKKNDVFIMPNSAYMSMVFIQLKQDNLPFIVSAGLDILTMITGEQPLRTISGSGTLFEGYSDPVINLVNSQLTKSLMDFLGNPLELPEVTDGGFFPHYNHTNDGNYTLKSGKNNISETALIQTWLGRTHLPWWGTEETQDIRNSGDGTFQKPGLTKNDKLKQFQSFTCRTFTLSSNGEKGHVNGIPALNFKLDQDNYDSIKHKGYRYENNERVNYFPEWPCGSNHQYNPYGCVDVDCELAQNFCSHCCNGSFVNNTYLLPPGIVPQRCLPGQITPVPFGAFLSAPHFYLSPPEVTNSMIGINPDPIKHDLGTFHINPTSGSTVGGMFRMQLSLPIFKSKLFTLMNNSPNSIIPAFWLEIEPKTKDYAISFLKLSMVILPSIILGIGIGLIVISVLSFVILIAFYVRKRINTRNKNLATMQNFED